MSNSRPLTIHHRLLPANIFAVILVGGKGKRLRPLSTNARPKAFLSIMKDGRTMFKATVDRIKKLIPSGNILVSANKAHMALVKKEFPQIKKENLILEPISRNTGPAIGVAAKILKARAKDAIMVVLPADQYVIDEQKYLDAIKLGAEFVDENEGLLLLALKPTFPSTEFGYMKVKGIRLKVKGKDIYNIYKVKKFVEKPDLRTAKRYISEGGYFWNAGTFVFSANAILRAIFQVAPEIFSILMRLDDDNIGKLYKDFPDISIDYAVMEKAENIYCVKGDYQWRDIGSFSALKEVLEMESRDFIWKNGKVVYIKP